MAPVYHTAATRARPEQHSFRGAGRQDETEGGLSGEDAPHVERGQHGPAVLHAAQGQDLQPVEEALIVCPPA